MAKVVVFGTELVAELAHYYLTHDSEHEIVAFTVNQEFIKEPTFCGIQVVPFEDLSIVSAPYEVDGQVVGTLGVIGPTRMAYDRMIQIVDITSKLVSNALSHHK